MQGQSRVSLKSVFPSIYSSFSIHATALKCRNTCTWYWHNALANAPPFEEIPSVKLTPAYTIGHNTKMSSSFCKLLFEYELAQETMNVAYSVRMIFFFFQSCETHISSVKSTGAWPMLVRCTKEVATLFKVPAWEILLPFNACNWD